MTTTTLRFRVPDMCCPHEFNAYAACVAKLDAGLILTPDYGARRLTVTVPQESAVTAEALLTALRSGGDTVERIPETPSRERVRISVPAMDCPVEAGAVEREMRRRGLTEMRFDTALRTLEVRPEDAEKAIEAVRAAGFDGTFLSEERAPAKDDSPKTPWGRYGVGLLLAFGSEAAELAHEYGLSALPAETLEGASLALAVAAIALTGFGTFRKGLSALRHLKLNMNALMAVAVVGGVLIGAWPEAAMVMVLFEISEAIEALSMARARNSIRKLMEVAPEVALVRTASGDYAEFPVADVGPGSVVRVAPGDRIPLDGRIETGLSTLDQSMVTGESMPVEKGPGDEVWAGTVNLTASLEVLVTQPASQSLTARIIEMVENAQASKSQVQRFVDRFAAVYTPIVFAAALLTFVIPTVFFDGDALGWLYKALTLLVIACPCALVISTPVTVVSALATATRCGLLVKGGLPLEEARRIRTVAFDKTGTLTKGEPRVVNLVTLSTSLGADPDSLLAVAAALARMNKHPLSRAIVRHAEERGVERPDASDFRALPGRGVEGRVRGGLVRLVNLAHLEASGLATDEARALVTQASAEGQPTVFLADAFGATLLFTFADDVREDAAEGLRRLEAEGIRPVLLTGDNRKAALSLAGVVGLAPENVHAELLPEDKLERIRALRSEGPVAMVGDGINDAPALAEADLGIAMGVRGTESAMEAADAALMDDRLSSIAALVRLSRKTHAVLLQNIVFALGVKFLFALLALNGLATMWMAVFADTGTCLIVVANGLRMLRAKEGLER